MRYGKKNKKLNDEKDHRDQEPKLLYFYSIHQFKITIFISYFADFLGQKRQPDEEPTPCEMESEKEGCKFR